ncbi:hypothetical protein [Acuticoccus mangrovi]|uniref:Cysteine rich repeat protein n=1 Tax=Acuticoccus mangrovi TaxID=2796142 RepID=A0A934MFF4_9HYPH|nr:hypothetical protein [Acuticoccus mangrovi]MBJ3774865.1 hypothetical protein [Acuticoccus mangrovi]
MALVVAVTGIGSAKADTVGYADAIKILSRDCGKDIERYCATATLANYGVGRCLKENQGKISGQCATSLVQVTQSIEARRAAQQSADQVCNRDIQRLCPMTKRGRGYTLQCLLKAQPSVSEKCNAAITNAGWR